MIMVATAEGAQPGDGVGWAAIRVQESEGSQQDEVRTMWGVRACEGPGRSFCTAMGKPQEEPASPNSIQPPGCGPPPYSWARTRLRPAVPLPT